MAIVTLFFSEQSPRSGRFSCTTNLSTRFCTAYLPQFVQRVSGDADVADFAGLAQRFQGRERFCEDYVHTRRKLNVMNLGGKKKKTRKGRRNIAIGFFYHRCCLGLHQRRTRNPTWACIAVLCYKYKEDIFDKVWNVAIVVMRSSVSSYAHEYVLYRTTSRPRKHVVGISSW